MKNVLFIIVVIAAVYPHDVIIVIFFFINIKKCFSQLSQGMCASVNTPIIQITHSERPYVLPPLKSGWSDRQKSRVKKNISILFVRFLGTRSKTALR